MVKKTGLLFICVLNILTFFGLDCAISGGIELTRYPGLKTELKSPDGRYVLYNIDTDDGEPNHAVFLKDTKNNKSEKLYSYNRAVDVLWSPQSSAIILNDFGGSDYANAYVIFIDKKVKIIDIKKELEKKFGDNNLIFRNHHVYIEGTRWVQKNKISVKIHGYGDMSPDGFVILYDYTIGGDFVETRPPE